jgi:hypothetical protein
MKIILTVALITLGLLSITAPVNAFDAKSFFEQADRSGGGGA